MALIHNRVADEEMALVDVESGHSPTAAIAWQVEEQRGSVPTTAEASSVLVSSTAQQHSPSQPVEERAQPLLRVAANAFMKKLSRRGSQFSNAKPKADAHTDAPKGLERQKSSIILPPEKTKKGTVKKKHTFRDNDWDVFLSYRVDADKELVRIQAK